MAAVSAGLAAPAGFGRTGWQQLNLAPGSYAVLVKRLRSARPGRQYRAQAEIAYTGGMLPDDVRESLCSALEKAMAPEGSSLSWSVSSDPYSRLTVTVTLAADRPLAAITRLDAALDDSLTAAGLAEEFDVTGRVLQVAPVDRVWREHGPSGRRDQAN